jgi:hypothetical protein
MKHILGLILFPYQVEAQKKKSKSTVGFYKMFLKKNSSTKDSITKFNQ